MQRTKSKHGNDEKEEQDPWIIPARSTAKVSSEDWGEAIKAKSDDSEEWRSPNEDWLKLSDSQVIESEQGGLDAASIPTSRDRDEDVLEMAARKKEMLENFGTPLESDYARDRDMLMAAKQKSTASSPRKAAALLAPSPKDALHSRLKKASDRRPVKKSSGDEKLQVQGFSHDDAFGSTLGDMEVRRNHFSEGIMGGDLDIAHSTEEEFFDAATYDEPKPVSAHPMVQRNGLFNIFGPKIDKRSKKSKASKLVIGSNIPILSTRKSPKEQSIPKTRSSHDTAEEGRKLTVSISTDVSLGPEVEGSPEQVADAYEDDGVSVVSEITNPTHFKDAKQDDGGVLPIFPEGHATEASQTRPPKFEATIFCGDDKLRIESMPEGQERMSEQPISSHHRVAEETAEIYDSLDPKLDHVVMENGSTDSEPGQQDTFKSRSQEKTGGNILSSAARRRKAEKLRRFEETNLRRKEKVYPGMTDQLPPSYSSRKAVNSSRYNKDVEGRTTFPEISLNPTSRHAKIKSNLSVNKGPKRHESHELVMTTTQSFGRGRKSSKARNYARQRAGYETPPPEADDTQSASDGSDGSKSLASIGSDIRMLRSIVQRPRKSNMDDAILRSRETFPTYDEATADPMQRAGLKLLSAAIIPMQAQVRRFLAMRHALTRMWALIVIQTYTRKWMAQKRYLKSVQSAIAIQALTRGQLARDDLDFKHVCAIEIQRVTRGYMATMRVYEDIYKVTMVQSYVRMRQAMDKATLKLAHVIQVQSVVRGFLTRRRQEYQQVCAVAIQANWRRFYTRLNYQFDLLDIIIVQSVWRKTHAIHKVQGLKKQRLDKAATKIQNSWRQYSCKMDFLQSLADILIAQSAIRRYLAVKKANRVKHKDLIHAQAVVRGFLGRKTLQKHLAARKIQSSWRGFVSYADYMFSVADIVAVQKVARGWLAKRAADNARELALAATTIQCACRMVLSKTQALRIAEVREIARLASEIADKEAAAVTSIQTVVRRVQTRSAYIVFLAARKIQAFWRCRNLHNAYMHYRAAVTIQSSFRAMKGRQEIVILKGEVLAATLIQSAWRGFLSYSDYIFTISDVITAQKMARGFLTRKNDGRRVVHALEQRRARIDAATNVQKGCRGLLARQRYWYTLGCTMQIQSWMRGRLVMMQLRREKKAQLKLQSFARRYFARQEYVQRKFILMLIQTAEQERSKKVAALVIQERARNFLDEKKKEGAARVIQRFFLLVRSEVTQIVQASKHRKNWRKKQSRRCPPDSGEDDLLEDAWLNAVSGSNNIGNELVLGETISNLGANTSKDWTHRRSRSSGGGESYRNSSIEVSSISKRKNRLPPAYSHGSSSTARRLNHDEEVEFSQLTASTSAFYRLPPARMKKMDPREMSDDLELEEAYIDAEIFTAKGRRIANKM